MIASVIKKPYLNTYAVALLLLLSLIYLLSLSSPYFDSSFNSFRFSSTSTGNSIWNVKRFIEWRPCDWWIRGHLNALPEESNGYIRVDCYGGLNQMRRDLCDGVGIARLLNATLVLPKFEVAAYWNKMFNH